jgi:hypothetical protein
MPSWRDNNNAVGATRFRNSSSMMALEELDPIVAPIAKTTPVMHLP